MTEALIVVLPLVFWWALPVYAAHEIGSRVKYRRAWLWAFFLGWIGVLVVWMQTRKVRQQIRREEEQREEEETGDDAETRKLRKFGLEDAEMRQRRVGREERTSKPEAGRDR